jgi:hypothetical protein
MALTGYLNVRSDVCFEVQSGHRVEAPHVRFDPEADMSG